MKGLQIRLYMRADNAPDYALELSIDPRQLDGVCREAAGLDGGAEWRHVEFFVRDGVRTALLNWADKTLPVVERLRAERDLTYAALGRGDVDPRVAFERLENYARRELKAPEVECEEAFAQFVFKHFGGYWTRDDTMRGSFIGALPERVERRVAQLARAL